MLALLGAGVLAGYLIAPEHAARTTGPVTSQHGAAKADAVTTPIRAPAQVTVVPALVVRRATAHKATTDLTVAGKRTGETTTSLVSPSPRPGAARQTAQSKSTPTAPKTQTGTGTNPTDAFGFHDPTQTSGSTTTGSEQAAP